MKKIAYTLILGLFFAACGNADKSDKDLSTDAIEHQSDNKEPKFEFEETSWDFGTITDGDRVEHSFKFKNVGNDDLVIGNVTTSCGCTAPEWPRTPIGPGEESKITVEFNSAGKSDLVNKDITIYANTVPVQTKLRIKAFVNKK